MSAENEIDLHEFRRNEWMTAEAIAAAKRTPSYRIIAFAGWIARFLIWVAGGYARIVFYWIVIFAIAGISETAGQILIFASMIIAISRT